jgi:hypothetical protein
MWLRAGLITALCFVGFASGSAQDDGPPPYAPSPVDYPDPLLVPTNPSPPAAYQFATGLRAKEEVAIVPHPRSGSGATAVPAPNK